METRVTTKKIEVKGREFVLEKFDPFFGVYIATTFISEISNRKEGIGGVIKSLLSKPKEEFIKLQKDILSYCYEILPVGRVRVVDESGNFAIQDVSSAMVLSLLVQSLMFSMTDFFDKEVMTGMTSQIEQALQGLSQELPQKH